MHQYLVNQYQKYLSTLADELQQYESEAAIWKIKAGILNSGGNLALHLVGNLNHYIGHVMGETDYVRDRPAEFDSKNVPVADIIDQIERTKSMIGEVLPKVDLDAPYPAEIYAAAITNGNFLLHLLAHLGYHLGQLNYHRRLI